MKDNTRFNTFKDMPFEVKEIPADVATTPDSVEHDSVVKYGEHEVFYTTDSIEELMTEWENKGYNPNAYMVLFQEGLRTDPNKYYIVDILYKEEHMETRLKELTNKADKLSRELAKTLVAINELEQGVDIIDVEKDMRVEQDFKAYVGDIEIRSQVLYDSLEWYLYEHPYPTRDDVLEYIEDFKETVFDRDYSISDFEDHQYTLLRERIYEREYDKAFSEHLAELHNVVEDIIFEEQDSTTMTCYHPTNFELVEVMGDVYETWVDIEVRTDKGNETVLTFNMSDLDTGEPHSETINVDTLGRLGQLIKEAYRREN